MIEPNRNRAARAAIWNILYYAACVAAIFYLKGREIFNWDTVLVFLPLVFLACSCEIFGGKRNERKIFEPWHYIDFAAKVCAFIAAQLIFRGIAADSWEVVCLCVFFALLCLSAACCFVMIKRAKNL